MIHRTRNRPEQISVLLKYPYTLNKMSVLPPLLFPIVPTTSPLLPYIGKRLILETIRAISRRPALSVVTLPPRSLISLAVVHVDCSCGVSFIVTRTVLLLLFTLILLSFLISLDYPHHSHSRTMSSYCLSVPSQQSVL